MGSAGMDIGSAVRKIREPNAIAFQGALKDSPIKLVPLPPDEFISSIQDASEASSKKAAVSFDFSNADSQSPTNSLGKELKALLDDQSFFDKKAAAAVFLKEAAGIDHSTNSFVSLGSVSSSDRKALKEMAQRAKELPPQGKVDLIKEMTGDQAQFGKLVETVLLDGQNVRIKDLLNVMKPENNDKGLSGYTEALSAVGAGLMLLPLVMPTSVVLNPNLGGHLFAAMGLALI